MFVQHRPINLPAYEKAQSLVFPQFKHHSVYFLSDGVISTVYLRLDQLLLLSSSPSWLWLAHTKTGCHIICLL